MPLQIYNSLTDQKEPFNPVHEGPKRHFMFVAPQFTATAISGTQKPMSVLIILRYLRFCGLKTLYVQNITDVGHLMGDADEGEDKL
ncbi:MAG: hypothetical protein Ct9H300mP21_07200 [Pseudomonadota bacterium]|nr:MAG: hypothetical protein Ct9H300mP21_07200 [Pseudomonadota bacterium]